MTSLPSFTVMRCKLEDPEGFACWCPCN